MDFIFVPIYIMNTQSLRHKGEYAQPPLEGVACYPLENPDDCYA